MSYIAAGNTTTTALTTYGDTTGNLVFTTGGANTTALTLSNTQAATFANNVTISGGLTTTGVSYFSDYLVSSSAIDATTVASGGFALRVRPPVGSATPGIIQFTNNPVTAQWATISSSAGNILNLGNSSGTTKITMDSGGRWITPSQTGFSAYRNTSPDLTGPLYPAVFNATFFNTGNAYNTSTGVFTAPVAGTYLFTTSGLSTTSNVLEMGFTINGSGLTMSGRNIGSGYASSAYCSLIYTLSAGDTVGVNIVAGTMYGPGYGNFNGYLLG